MSKKPMLSIFKPVENVHNGYNSTWLENLDKFNNMLSVQESRLTAFTENIETENNANDNKNYELAAILAAKYLDDGNAYLDDVKYKLAIICYREGVFLDYPNVDLRVDLLIHLIDTYYIIQDYRSCLKFVEQMFKIDPDHNKTLSKAIKCCIQLNEIDQSLVYCNRYLINKKGSLEEELEKKVFQSKIEQQQLLFELSKRDINLSKQDNENFINDLNSFKIKYPGNVEPVRLFKTSLVWPVIFYCPEYSRIVFIKEFHENDLFYTHLVDIFSQRPMWDVKGEYTADTVNMYFDCPSENGSKLIQLDVKTCSLAHALTMLKCPIDYGIPTFLIFVAGGRNEKSARKDYPTYIHKWMRSLNNTILVAETPENCHLRHFQTRRK